MSNYYITRTNKSVDKEQCNLFFLINDSDEKYQISDDYIPTIPRNIRTNNTPIIVISSSSHVAQTKCLCGGIHPDFNSESTKHKCTVSGLKGLKLWLFFCLNLDEYDDDEASSISALCVKCLQ